MGIMSESERGKEKKREGQRGRERRERREASALWCCCIKACNDRVQSSGPTGLRLRLCSVISPDRPGTLEPLLRHWDNTTWLNEEQAGAGGPVTMIMGTYCNGTYQLRALPHCSV